MKNLYATFILGLLIPLLSAAQNNYKPGYLILLKGDTLHGFINCKAWNRNPKEFTFKDSLNDSKPKNFSASNARAIVIPGYKIYNRFVVDISQDEVNEGSISPVLNTKHITDTVFLDLIDSGKNVTLYQYTDKIKERFFINEKNAQPVELILHVYPDPDHFSELRRQEIYKRQLQHLAAKYLAQFQQVVNEAQGAAYKKEDIENIVFEINGADKATTFTMTKTYKARSFAGFGLSALAVHDFGTDDYLPLLPNKYPDTKTQQAVSGEINLGEDIFFSQKEKSLILRLELHAAYSGNSTITDNESGILLEQYHTLAVSFNPQLLFNIYNSGSAKVYFGAGGQLFFLGGAKVSFIQQDYYDLNPPAYYAINFTFTTRADIILNNKFDIYAGYNPVSPPGQQQNTLTAFRVGINYLFGVK